MLAVQAQNISKQVIGNALPQGYVILGEEYTPRAEKLPADRVLGPCVRILLSGSLVKPTWDSELRRIDERVLECLMGGCPLAREVHDRLLFFGRRLDPVHERSSSVAELGFDLPNFDYGREVASWPALSSSWENWKFLAAVRNIIPELAPEGCCQEFEKKLLLYEIWAVLDFLLTGSVYRRLLGTPLFGREFKRFQSACVSLRTGVVEECCSHAWQDVCESPVDPVKAEEARASWAALVACMETDFDEGHAEQMEYHDQRLAALQDSEGYDRNGWMFVRPKSKTDPVELYTSLGW